jgi:hypothetical protein
MNGRTCCLLLLLVVSNNVHGTSSNFRLEGAWNCINVNEYEGYKVSQNLLLLFENNSYEYVVEGLMTVSPVNAEKSSLRYRSTVDYRIVDVNIYSKTREFKVEHKADPSGFFDQPTIESMANMSSTAVVGYTKNGNLIFKYDDGFSVQCEQRAREND